MHAVLAQILAADPTPTGWLALLVALLGTGGLGALLGPPIREYYRARAERERDESEQRRKRYEAEIDQIKTITSMAGSVPTLTEEIRRDRAARADETKQIVGAINDGFASMREALSAVTRATDAHTRAVDDALAELRSEHGDTLRAVADAVGANGGPRSASPSAPTITTLRPIAPR